MWNIVTLPEEVSHLIQPVEGKPGFVCLPYDALYQQYFQAVINYNTTDCYSPEAQYINPSLNKEFIRQLLVRINPAEIIQQAIKICNDGRAAINNIETSTTETTAELKFDIVNIEDSFVVHGSFDHVPAVRFLFWPHQAKAWITQPRLWPPQCSIECVVGTGCQLVPRSSPGGDANSEWRLSFSSCEAFLARLRSKEQQRAYYFFKMFFYRYLKSIDSSEPNAKPLYSYVMKTIMMWACEDLPPEDKLWTSLEDSVQLLLFKLLGSLEVGNVPHYFIPEINLLERVGQDVRSKSISVISSLQKNIFFVTPFDMPEKYKYVEFIQRVCFNFSQMVDMCFFTCLSEFKQH